MHLYDPFFNRSPEFLDLPGNQSDAGEPRDATEFPADRAQFSILLDERHDYDGRRDRHRWIPILINRSKVEMKRLIVCVFCAGSVLAQTVCGPTTVQGGSYTFTLADFICGKLISMEANASVILPSDFPPAGSWTRIVAHGGSVVSIGTMGQQVNGSDGPFTTPSVARGIAVEATVLSDGSKYFVAIVEMKDK